MRAAALGAAMRKHWLLLVLLAAGIALRGMALLAYRPVIVLHDSRFYLLKSLNLAPGEQYPLGYPVFLKLLRAVPFDSGLGLIPLVQHGLGVAVAIALYALLTRVGARRGLAAVAVAPVLLDAYWVAIEQSALSESLFLTLVVLGCVALLWRRPIGTAGVALAAVALSAAALTRTVGVLLLVPAGLTVVALAAPGGRLRLALLFILVAGVPLAGYAAWYSSAHGSFALGGYAGRYLYGRVATFVDCRGFAVPAGERVLCPSRPISRRPEPDYYIWHEKSPLRRLSPEAREEVAGRFAKRAILHQPLAYGHTVAADVLRCFTDARTSRRRGEPPPRRWAFQPRYPVWVGRVLCGGPTPDPAVGAECARKVASRYGFVRRFGDDEVAVNATLASWLADYRQHGYVPGPLLGIVLLVAIAGAALALLRRGSSLPVAALLMTGVTLTLLVGPIMTTHFSWRYAVPALLLVPVAGALGWTALVDRRALTRGQSPRDTRRRSHRCAPANGTNRGGA